MLKNVLPLGIDELVALILLGLTLIFPQFSLLAQLQGLIILYLFMCIGLRKYEAIQQKYRTPESVERK